MNRRSLFARFGAVAAAVALAPKAGAAGAAPEFTDAERAGYPSDMALADTYAQGYLTGFGQARAEGYEQARAALMDGFPSYVPTLDAMQADCEAHGCYLDFKQAAGGLATHVLTHVQGGTWVGFDYHGESSAAWLARVDAWRRSLHGTVVT